MPTSRETLVLVDDFSNKRPMLLPIRGQEFASAPDLSSIDLFSRRFISAEVKSSTVRKSLFNTIYLCSSCIKMSLGIPYSNFKKIP